MGCIPVCGALLVKTREKKGREVDKYPTNMKYKSSLAGKAQGAGVHNHGRASRKW